jgi:outer membrane lipoprotein carrier protein
VKRIGGAVCLCLASSLWGADAELGRTLKAVEHRYNNSRSLRVEFSQTYTQGGSRRVESGELWLRKPGRMRWNYNNPPGKLFLSDGKFIYLYSPATNRAEKMKLKETEDLRAPLAFLLGKLDFSRDFKDFRAKRDGGRWIVTGYPKSNKLPYTEVTFTVSEKKEIERLVVLGQDRSVLEFHFANEIVNPPVDESLFRFTPPKGVEVVDNSEQG